MVGFILILGEMQLLSFDDQSIVYVWCLKTFKLQRRIDTASALESIISMNVCKNRLVAGGMNGRVVVWDINTGSELMSIQTNASFGSPLNVGVRDDILVYGLPSGKYVVYKGNEKVYDLDLVQASKKMEESRLMAISNQELSETEPEQLLDNFPSSHLSSIPMKKELEIIGTSVNTSATSTTLNSPAPQPFQEPEVGLEEPFNIIPRTLALNSHILVTNGATPNSMITWDLNTGKYLHTLSENHAASRHSVFIPDLTSEIQLGEMTGDGSLVFASVEHDLDNRILVWDFDMGISQRELSVYKVLLETRAEESLFIWVFSSDK
jgi:WD40 repeat protein